MSEPPTKVAKFHVAFDTVLVEIDREGRLFNRWPLGRCHDVAELETCL